MADESVPGSRCFVVCGKAVTGEELKAAFAPYGQVESVKLVSDKGVAYVKYDKASSAALAIESLNGATLNNGRGPKLKVLLADAPNARGAVQARQVSEAELSADPDNVPPRSRLFIVVPKSAEPQQIQGDICAFPDVEYCKTDLVSSKGVVFCKFNKSSSALKALEAISERGTVAGYKVKVMLAEPKTKRVRQDGSPQEMMYQMHQTAKLDYGMNGMDPLKFNLGGGLGNGQIGMPGYEGIGGLGLNNLNNFNALATNMNNMNNLDQLGSRGGQGLGFGLPGSMHNSASPVSPNNAAGMPLCRQRLFIVVNKNVSDAELAKVFRRFPGMEYCDLKKDKITGKSKGYCYVNYSTPEAAAAAVSHLNGIEFPAGYRMKVMFAEPLGVRPGGATGSSMGGPSPLPGASTGTMSTSHGGPTSSMSPGAMSMNMAAASPSGGNTPLSRSNQAVSGVSGMTPDTLSESLATLSMHRVGSVVHSSGGVLDQDGMEQQQRMAAAARMSPVAPGGVARELMFNVS